LLEAIQRIKRDRPVAVVPIFFVDNSDRSPLSLDIFDDKKDQLDKLNVELRRLSGHGNIGYGSANNIVLEKIESEFHLILNPDVVLEKEALLNAIDMMSINKDVKVLSPNAKDSLGKKQHLCKRYPSILILFIRAFCPTFLQTLFSRRLAAYEMREISELQESDRIVIISGCFMFAETKALKEIGGFDENYFLYFEDFDLSLRIGRLGKLAYASNVQIIHSGGNTASKGLRHIWAFIVSGIRFFNTHGWRIF
jgi:hypothetical protein